MSSARVHLLPYIRGIRAAARRPPKGVTSCASTRTGRLAAQHPCHDAPLPPPPPLSLRAPAGATDASTHIQSMAANCPSTRMVLGGYSQGAGVIDSSTTAMPPQVADHVAAAALFGTASRTRRSGATRRHPQKYDPGGSMYLAMVTEDSRAIHFGRADSTCGSRNTCRLFPDIVDIVAR